MNAVTVDLRHRDLLIAQFQMVSRRRAFKLLFAALLAFSFYILYTSHPRPPAVEGIPISFLVAGLVTLAALLITYLISAGMMLRKLRRTPGVLGKHAFTIDVDGLRELTDVNETRVAFGYAQKVFRTRKYIFIRMHARGFLLIPRRSFADAVADSQFWNALQPLAVQKKK